MTSIPDGRFMRGTINKAKLLEAALLLIKQGNWRPAPEEIVEMAGLSLRTFYTHFRNVDNFYEELIAAFELSLLSEADRYNRWDTIRIMLRGRKPT